MPRPPRKPPRPEAYYAEPKTGRGPGIRARLAGIVIGVFDGLDSDSDRQELAELVSLYEAAGKRRSRLLELAREYLEG